MQVYAWQLGVLFLGATVACIVAGMVFLVWSAVVDDLRNGRGFSDNGKVCVNAFKCCWGRMGKLMSVLTVENRLL